MADYKRYTVTAALPYTNGPVHIGQLAGAYLPADIYARYLRLRYGKENVVFVCGSDEHGVPITLKARKEGISPQQLVDKYHQIIKQSFEDFGIDFDIYHRTSAPLHHETAAHFFKVMYDNNIFELQESEQYFDEVEQQFLADRYIVGTCPHCHNENAYGDQCEKCGTSLSPFDLINPRSAISGNTPVLKKTKHWYIPLDKMQKEWINDWILDGKGRAETWKNHVMGQCKSWLEQGLQPRAVTRDLSWGVNLPIPHTEGKVLYVWFDAPIGYISATKAWAEENNKDWRPFWQSNDTKLVHFIGKDNIVFHCIIFPAMLKAMANLGEPYILPTNIPANQFMNMEGQKMSTSRNWTVWLNEYLVDFPQQQDSLRYALLMNMPENKDSDFSWRDFQFKNDSELVANLGNFVNRVMVLQHKYFEGILQDVPYTEEQLQLLENVKETYWRLAENYENYNFKLAMQEVMAVSSWGNKFLADNEPWKTIKTNPQATAAVLNTALQIVAHLAIMLKPLLPQTATKMAAQIHLPEKYTPHFQANESIILKAHHSIGEAVLLFQKIDEKEIERQLEKLEKSKQTNAPISALAAAKPEVDYDTFAKIDMRVGTIVAAEKVAKADKLLKLSIDVGFEKRTIVSGIAQHFSPEELLNKQVVVLVNLAPRKLRGIVSEGMLLTAENPDGSLQLIAPPQLAENGATIA
ncbi:MAG: methionine--tRNA ligase [Chitinophagales bacterium]|nr:methionine--tRNA ligase [Bacteroidota bacterium]